MSWRRGQPLHLLEVGVRWPPETFLARKLAGLATRGMRVTVASNRIIDPDARLEGVELLAIPRRPATRAAAARVALRAGLALLVTSPRRLVRLVRGVRREMSAAARIRYGGTIGLLSMCLPLARLRPDVVHFEHRAAVDYLPLFDVWDCPVATTCRGSDISVYPHVPGAEHYARRLPELHRRVSAVHCISDSLQREAIAFGLDPAKAWVIKPGVDPDLFRPARNGWGIAERNGDVLRVITVGWLRWMKGHEYGLAAIRSLLNRDVPVRLEVVGVVPSEWRRQTDERARILHAVADLGLEEHVRLCGWVSPAEISRRLQASDVLLHPSVTEGIPSVLVEAMACEVPVVATDCGGVAEAVTDGVEGFLVACRDPDQLASALLRLWHDPGLRVRMGRAGRARVLSEFTLEHLHGAFLAMYREVTEA